MYANGNKYVSADLVCLVYLALALLALKKRGEEKQKTEIAVPAKHIGFRFF